MFELEITRQFSSAHRLIGYPGDCQKLHGHNYMVTVIVEAIDLDDVGIALDFKVFKGETERIISRYDHAYLNELEEYAKVNPTSENLARNLYKQLSAALNAPGVKVTRVKVAESAGSAASYYE